jgi:hypothetical protein
MTLDRFLRGRWRDLLWFALALAPNVALACRVPPPASEVVFYDLPPRLPADLTILKVSFPASGPLYAGETPRLANVHAVVRGAYSGKSVKVLVDGAQSGGCRHAYTSSKTGYIIGRLRHDPGGEVYFLPIYETVEDRQKRGGIQRPEPPMVQPVVKPFRIFQPLWVKEPTTADVLRHRPRGEVPWQVKHGVFIRCGVAANGTLNNCRNEGSRDLAPTWSAAAVQIARVYRMNPTTREGWRVDGGEVDFRITFDPPQACEAINVCR